ncbi:MAG: hypothetical protein AAGA23_00055 [Pseudomonadota bacterium]
MTATQTPSTRSPASRLLRRGLWMSLLAGALGSGCATSDIQRSDRIAQHEAYVQTFIAARNACNHAGGTMMIVASGGVDSRGVPRGNDRYSCH